MLNCCIIDDHIHAVRVLEGHARKMGMPVLVSETNPIIALKKINALETPVDILFCDIDMPGLSGMDLADLIDKNIMLVFTSAHEKFAVAGYEKEATFFLLKLISYENFANCVAFCERKKRQREGKPGLNTVFLDHLVIRPCRSKADRDRVATAAIVYIRSQSNYLYFKLSGEQEELQSYNTFANVEPYLDPDKYVRANRSYIVNMDYVTGTNKNWVCLKETETKIALGEGYKPHLMDKMGIHINPKGKPADLPSEEYRTSMG